MPLIQRRLLDRSGVGAPDALCRSDAREREADRHEHLLDVVAIERPDEHDLDDDADDRADDDGDEQRDREPGPDGQRLRQVAHRQPAGIRTGCHEDPVGEVEHAHESVDEAEAARGEEVEGAEAEAR